MCNMKTVSFKIHLQVQGSHEDFRTGSVQLHSRETGRAVLSGKAEELGVRSASSEALAEHA